MVFTQFIFSAVTKWKKIEVKFPVYDLTHVMFVIIKL